MYRHKRTAHVHPLHLVLQIVKHVIIAGRCVVAINTGRRHAVSCRVRWRQRHWLHRDVLP